MGRDRLAVLVQTSTIHREIPEESEGSSGAQAPSSLRLSTHFLPPGAGGGAGGQAEGAQERGPAPAAQEPGAGGAEDQPPPGALHLQVRLGPIPVGQRGWEEEKDGWEESKMGSHSCGTAQAFPPGPQWGITAGIPAPLPNSKEGFAGNSCKGEEWLPKKQVWQFKWWFPQKYVEMS